VNCRFAPENFQLVFTLWLAIETLFATIPREQEWIQVVLSKLIGIISFRTRNPLFSSRLENLHPVFGGKGPQKDQMLISESDSRQNGLLFFNTILTVQRHRNSLNSLVIVHSETRNTRLSLKMKNTQIQKWFSSRHMGQKPKKLERFRREKCNFLVLVLWVLKLR